VIAASNHLPGRQGCAEGAPLIETRTKLFGAEAMIERERMLMLLTPSSASGGSSTGTSLGRSRRPALHLHASAPPSQWRSVRTTNAIERLHEEFKRRIKTQTVLPSTDTAAMLFWALLASGEINMRKVDGWHTLATKPSISNHRSAS
jgi:hypothetical protein